MALSVPVQKDLAEYEPKFIGKFTLRTLVAIALSLAMAFLTGCYINFVVCVSIDDYGWLVMLAALPGWAIGFWKPDQMRPEEWLPLWFIHAMTPDDLAYERTFAAPAGAEADMEHGKEKGLVKKEKRAIKRLAARGAELYSPTSIFQR